MRTHGGQWAEFLEERGRMPLDFSCNTSPLGMPEVARVAASAALAHADRYPDPRSRALCRALARKYGLDAEAVLIGNGAGDLIDRLALALHPRRALVTAPTFAEYRAALERVGCDVDAYLLDEKSGFVLDAGIVERIDSRLDVVFLCEPNNPTGRTSDLALLERVAERCDETGALLVVDECFEEFVDEADSRTLLRWVGRHHVLALRAFTKFYGMAGLRLGWCACADLGLLELMADAGQPWPVSMVAQEAGIAALADESYAERVRSLVTVEREMLASGLRDLGCRVVPGEANYLLFFDETPDLAFRLAERGVLVRDCSDYEGIGEGWYRVAVRTNSDNAQLLRAMEEAHR